MYGIYILLSPYMQDKLPYVSMQHTYNKRYIYVNMQLSKLHDDITLTNYVAYR